MRIAFTHNVQANPTEDEAEFDTPKTVAAIADALRGLGHDVEPIEVSGDVAPVVARLSAHRPDLVFNTAEGRHGRFREAFFPALFDHLGLPFTGSDAHTCALTLDKQLTKIVLARHGIPVARDRLIRDARDAAAVERDGLRFPLIVKPNYEGSSMGIGPDSVVEDAASLRERVAGLVGRYPAGVLVEEYVRGRDIVVPYVALASPATHGVLEPAGYAFDTKVTGVRKYPIYDLALKTWANDSVEVKVPAGLPDATRRLLMETSHTIFDVLQVRDLGRIDFRVRDDGSICFLEINALPSLEDGAAIFLSAALAGLPTQQSVLDCVVRSASERAGNRPRP